MITYTCMQHNIYNFKKLSIIYNYAVKYLFFD